MSARFPDQSESATEVVDVGMPAPDFTLTTDSGADWRLSDQLGKVAVLLFYPRNETVICTRQLCSVRDNWEKYLETRAVIVGISNATPVEHKRFSQSRDLPIPLLADAGRAVTRVFSKHRIFPLSLTRGVVVVDARGIIRNRDVMLRAFRPSDDRVITDIYAARGDAFNETRNTLRQRIARIIDK